MVNEFSSETFSCSEGDIVPRGNVFDDIRFQTCAVSGSSPSQLSVSGQSYLSSEYNFHSDRLWRNIGINAAFFLFFAICVAYVSCFLEVHWASKRLTWLSYGMERFKPAAGRLATTFFKRGALQHLNTSKLDIESRSSQLETPPTEIDRVEEKSLSPKQSQNVIPEGHTFLWQNLSLDLKNGAEGKRLLDNVSGEF